mgnify:CR=1 FL=1
MKNKNWFGHFLKNKRILSGLSQGKVSKEFGYNSPQFVSNWERGLCCPPMKTLKELCSLYSIEKKEMKNVLMKKREQEIDLGLKG